MITRNVAVMLIALSVHFSISILRAETIYGVTDAGTQRLFHFDSASPGTVTAVGNVTGISPGHFFIQAIDFRPTTGQLYGISSEDNFVQLYTINPATAAATKVGTGFEIVGDPEFYYGIDFDPVADQLRIVTGRGNNLRINPNSGAVVSVDTDVAYVAGDPNAGGQPLISGIAYTNNFPGATSTTLYGFDDLRFRNVVRIGSIGGAPFSPNTGLMLSVGQAGVISFDSKIGLDISGVTGIAYLELDPGSPSDTLYRLNLSTGTATLIGEIGQVIGSEGVRDISAAPVPEPVTIFAPVFSLASITAFTRLRPRNRHRAI